MTDNGHKQDDHEHHDHRHDISQLSKGKLLLVIFFNLAISIAEIVGGLISGSLSLLSDSIHNLSDTVSIIFSYVSIRISEKPKSKTKTYGYNRANILAAFVNSAALIGISVFLLVEAVRRFVNPTQIAGDTVIVIAIVGLVGNLLSVLVLRKSAKQNMNIKSSYLHLMSDTLSSVAVIVAGILIKFASVYWIDPLMTILINIVIFRSSFRLLKESIDILMQAVPLHVDIEKLRDKLLTIKDIKSTHHIHVWQLDEKNTILEGHVQVSDMLLSETHGVCEAINELLEHEFDINHTVIQFESTVCKGENCHI